MGTKEELDVHLQLTKILEGGAFRRGSGGEKVVRRETSGSKAEGDFWRAGGARRVFAHLQCAEQIEHDKPEVSPLATFSAHLQCAFVKAVTGHRTPKLFEVFSRGWYTFGKHFHSRTGVQR
jgi:hypothetical protein